MNARFGIIAGFCITLAGCNDGSSEDLFVEETSAALDCSGARCTFSGATKHNDPPNTPDAGYGGHGGDDDDHHGDDDDRYGEGGGDDQHDDDDYSAGGGHTDAGAPCNYDDDCAKGEKCERRHGVSYCAPEDEPECDGYDCDYDRSGSNSGPH